MLLISHRFTKPDKIQARCMSLKNINLSFLNLNLSRIYLVLTFILYINIYVMYIFLE